MWNKKDLYFSYHCSALSVVFNFGFELLPFHLQLQFISFTLPHEHVKMWMKEHWEKGIAFKNTW